MLAEQTQFLDDASHQLRTPLAIMLTQAQYALRERDPDGMREGLRGIISQLGRSRRLTEQLLQLAHASQGQVTPRKVLDTNDLARDVVLQYLPLAHEKQQDLGWDGVAQGHGGAVGHPIEDESSLTAVAPVAGSEVELHEALSNLVHNAVNYAPSGARITVSVVVEDDRVEVRVADNGAGIEPALRARAFERFNRAGAEGGQGAASGSGLGLAIARAYARRNGGDILLQDGESNASGGVGLSAILWIPLLRDNPLIQGLDSVKKAD
jgi:two-component system, OmpR family, sensor histidine kinase TctE